MNGKVYTLKPDVAYKRQVYKEKTTQEISFKERFLESVETFILFLLISLFLVLSVGVAYKSLLYIKVKNEKRVLLLEKNQLQEQLNRLTSREVVLEKAKKLGLRPPAEIDYINLK